MKTCSVEDCGSRVTAKGLCGKHYNRQRLTGTTEPRQRLVDELCSCGLRFAQYGTLQGKPLDHPLCNTCHQKALRAARPVEDAVCAREGCGNVFTALRVRTKGQFNWKRYCSRECKRLAYVEDGRHAEVAQRSYYKRRYGLTPEQADELRSKTVCEICGAKPVDNGRWGNLNIDHCHKTGKVRGVLCSECNNGMGKFHDDPALLQKAIDYLAAKG